MSKNVNDLVDEVERQYMREKVLDIATTILAHMAANVEGRPSRGVLVKEALLYAETLWRIWEEKE